ncbi:MAG: caspase family protein [Desulfomonile tiedjei]|uniref:Caspase family protein n=1 Tax=Desulfomonile tiedjei TaxID=2358 RepID=A0A9D6V411_9BACT|nr:caspase family protein [Desulfomonile tiedjei]
MRLGIVTKSMLVLVAVLSWASSEFARAEAGLTINRALLVGIENYPDPEDNLPGVIEDLNLLSSALVKSGMVQPANIKRLVDREATKANIVQAFKDWLVNGTNPGEVVFFYYSGHGVQVWDEDGDELQDGLDEAYVCWDTEMVRQKTRREFMGRPGFAFDAKKCKNLLMDDEAKQLIQDLSGRTLIFVSDSCHSGTMYKRLDGFFGKSKTIQARSGYKSVFEPRESGDSRSQVGQKQAVKTGLVDHSTAPGVELIALSAAEDSQPAQVVEMAREPKGFHSVYTWFLYHAMAGAADLNRDGKTTFQELADYLSKEIEREGYAQIPQKHFSNKELSSRAFLVTGSQPSATAEQPSELACLLKLEGGLSEKEKQHIQSELKRRIPKLSIATNSSGVAGVVSFEKKSGVYGGRLSDSTGTYWEPQLNSNLEEVINKVAGNLRALQYQTAFRRLQNRNSAAAVDVELITQGAAARKRGQVVNGDRICFKAKAQQGGYLYIANVDSEGVIHPLYPMHGPQRTKVASGESVSVGCAEGSFAVGPPFGKEMLIAFLLPEKNDLLEGLWQKDSVGEPQSENTEPQEQFIGAIRRVLFDGTKPKGTWSSATILVESYKE